jgi:hypothetical protein
MTVSALRNRAAGKAVWGRAILVALLAMLLLPAAPVEASGRNPASPSGYCGEAGRACRARGSPPRETRSQLNDAVEDAVNGESNVIIEFNDETDAVNLVKANGGKAGRRLGILKARVAKMSNRKLKALANDKRVKRIHLDRATTTASSDAPPSPSARARCRS